MALRKAVDNLCVFDPGFRMYAEKFLAEMGGNSAVEPVSSMADLDSAIHSYSNVRFLEVCLHGSPGMIEFADGVVMVGHHLGNMMHGVPFLAKNARVLFNSCNIAEGAAGDNFMERLGQTMLAGKGGIIGGSTAKTHNYFPRGSFVTEMYIAPLSFGRLKVRRYDESGSQVGERVVDRHGISR